MRTFIKSLVLFLLLSISAPVVACFGPKLYVGTPAGVDGELLYHLVTIYVQEKTGVESERVEFAGDEAAEDLLQQEKIDFGFSQASSAKWPHLLSVSEELFLLSGPRPTEDLQFTTVPKALSKLQALLLQEDLALLRSKIEAGQLPAKAVRNLYMQRGWI